MNPRPYGAGALTAGAVAAEVPSAAYNLWQTPHRYTYNPNTRERIALGGADTVLGHVGSAAASLLSEGVSHPLLRFGARTGLATGSIIAKRKALELLARALNPQNAQIAENANTAYNRRVWELAQTRPLEALRQAALSHVFGYDTELRARMRQVEADKISGGLVTKHAAVGYMDALMSMNVKVARASVDKYKAMIQKMTKGEIEARAKLVSQRASNAAKTRKERMADGVRLKRSLPSRQGIEKLERRANTWGQLGGSLKPGYRPDGSHTVAQGAKEIGDHALEKFHRLGEGTKNNIYLAGGAGLLGAGALGYHGISKGIDAYEQAQAQPPLMY